MFSHSLHLFPGKPQYWLFGAAIILTGACTRSQVTPEIGAPIDTGSNTVIVQPSIPTSTYTTPATTNSGVHIVQPREGLYGIARLYGLNFKDIAVWNNISPPYILQPGQTLMLSPTGSYSGGYSTPAYNNTPAYSAPYNAAPATSSYYNSGGSYYTVQRGDTLYSISRRYGRHFSEVASWNSIAPPYHLSVGQSLRVSP